MPKPEFMKLWDYGNPEATEKKFREAEPEIKKQGQGLYIELLTQIARTHSLRAQFDEAHKILDTAMKMIGPEHVRPRIYYMLERGRTYNSSKVYDKAEELFEAAYGQAVKYGEDNLAIDAAHMMGIVKKGDESLQWNEDAMNMAENTADEEAKGWLGPLYNNTGWTYHDMGEYEKALDLFERNVEYHGARGNKNELSIAKWCVARCLRSLGKLEESLKAQYDLTELNKQLGLDDDGYNYEEIGECLLELGKGDEAKPYFAKAYELLSKERWLASNEKERLERLKKLGE